MIKGELLIPYISHLEAIGYGVTYLLLNSSTLGVPQNRVRVYILGLLNKQPLMTIQSELGAADSHKFKLRLEQCSLFGYAPQRVVRDILEAEPDPKYDCSENFTNQLLHVIKGDLNTLHGIRLIDYRGGNSIHSWDLGIKGKCSKEEISFMRALISNRRKKHFGVHQDGKMLTLEQISTFFPHPNLGGIIKSLEAKGYIKEAGGKYNPVAGNMSFEVFKFLDPNSVSITLVTSDAHKLGVVYKGRIRRITPRECARLQGFPDSFIHHPVDVHAYRQFGNSVSVPVIRAVILDLFKGNGELATVRSAPPRHKSAKLSA